MPKAPTKPSIKPVKAAPTKPKPAPARAAPSVDPRVPIKSMDGLNSVFRKRLAAFLAAAKRKGFTVLVYETTRTLERQKYLFSLGRTRNGSVVTYTLQSVHRVRCAVDLVCMVKGQADWSWQKYQALYKAVPPKEFGLEILSWERPHLQIEGGWDTAIKLGVKPI